MQQPGLSPETLQELEKISLETLIDPLPDVSELPMSAMAARTPRPFTHMPDPQKFYKPKNFCGQAAVACLAVLHGKNPYAKSANPEQELMDFLYYKYPPDIVGGVFGTSANRICSALKDGCKFRQTLSMRLEPWITGGLANPINLAAYSAYSNSILTYVNAGYPVIVMVDNGKLGDNWHVYHWLVLYKGSPLEVYVCNSTNKTNGTYHAERMSMPLFASAWEAPYLPPGFRFNAVVAIP